MKVKTITRVILNIVAFPFYLIYAGISALSDSLDSRANDLQAANDEMLSELAATSSQCIALVKELEEAKRRISELEAGEK